MTADRGSDHNRLEDRRPARIGIVVESTVVPQWMARIVSDLVCGTDGDLRLVLLVERGAAGAQDVGGVLRNALRGALWRVYERLDYRMHRAIRDALAPTDISEILADRPAIVLSEGAGTLEYLDSKAKRELEHADLDVILDLEAVLGRSEIATTARHGIWSLRHGDRRLYANGPPYFWEIFHGDPVTATTLEEVCGPAEPGHVLYHSHGATDLTSLYRSRNSAYWKSAQFALRRLRDLRERGSSYVHARATIEEPRKREPERLRVPSNFEMLMYFGRLAARGIPKKLFYRSRRLQWFLVFGERDDSSNSGSAQRFYAVFPDYGRFFADPFLMAHDGKDYLFFEDYEYASGKAVISYVEIAAERKRIEPRVALERPYHLSYPFIFEFDGVIYMLPETSGAQRIELYRAESFPDEWILDRVLIENATAVDPTLIVRKGTIWLFANMPAFGARDTDELHLYSAASLDGEWTAHPMNPVVSDVRRARPAGRIFEHDGVLIRPGQDSSRTYGYAVVLNRIEVLTHDSYSEEEIARIDAGWLGDSRATHTYNSNSRYEVVDAQRFVGWPPQSRRRHSTIEPLPARDRPHDVFDRPGAVRGRPLLSSACASPMRIEERGSGLARETT